MAQSKYTPEYINALLARVKQQKQPSIIPGDAKEGKTIKDDIQDALKEESIQRVEKQTIPIVEQSKHVAEVSAIGLTALERLKQRIAGISTEDRNGTIGSDVVSSPHSISTAPQNSDIGGNDKENGINQESGDKPIEESNSNGVFADSRPTESAPKDQNITTDKYGNEITLNSRQAEFVTLSGDGKSCVLIGPAGTGKTTCQKVVVQNLISKGLAGTLSSQGHKHLSDGTPGIVICSYTRRAVANIRRNVSVEMQGNCITIHKLLEYQPEYFTEINESGEEVTKMAFTPNRHAGNPLPPSIKTIIFEESSMLGIDLYKEVIDACPHNPQLIFLGDIQQLPPVFGPAILGFKLLELPVVELTEVYRQALESPIIRLAHRILSGKAIPAAEYPEWKVENQLTIRPWKKKIDALNALNTIALMFCGNKHTEPDPKKQAMGLEEAGVYNPEEDIILIPFNKSCGTDELNKRIGHYLARKRDAEVFEVIAGFNKHYLSVGEKVLFDKEDATIIKIESNPSYAGVMPRAPSKTMDYDGFDPVLVKSAGNKSDDEVDFLLSQVASSDTEDRVHAASHIITLSMNDSDATYRIDKAGDINSLLLGYALTVHKSQGSEWRKVFCIFHQSHATMLQRELLYTAVTRAREELFIVCEPETFTNGIRSQRVKGDTLAEKAEYFKGRKSEFAERIGQ